MNIKQFAFVGFSCNTENPNSTWRDAIGRTEEDKRKEELRVIDGKINKFR